MSELAGRYLPCGCWQSFMAESFGEVEFCPTHEGEWAAYRATFYGDPHTWTDDWNTPR